MIGASGALLEARPAARPRPSGLPGRVGFETDSPAGGTTKWNTGGTWPGGDRTKACGEFRAAYKSCPWLSAAIDVTARTITAGGIVVTPDEDADQVFADDPENRPSDGDQGSGFDRASRRPPRTRTPDEALGWQEYALELAAAGDVTAAREAVTEAVLAARRPARTDDRGATDRDARQQTDDGEDTPAPGVDVEDNRPQSERRTQNRPPREPLAPERVKDLRRFLAFCNPREDIRQILRGVVTDLQTYGDAFLEVVWLLGKPAALYSLDSPSMSVQADEHGNVTGYTQSLGDAREVTLNPHQVIHIAMDSPDGSLYGIGVAAKVMLPVTVWLYASSLLRQRMKLGDPPTIHAHFGLEASDGDIRKWRDQYKTTVNGIDNVGTPITTVGMPQTKPVTELQTRQHTNLLEILRDSRDTIISGCGVTPAKVGIIESGNIGSGTGGDQDRTFRVNTCGPLEQLIMEKLNYALLPAFGIEGWSMSFEDMDWRDDKDLEEIRDMRIRNGSWTLNRYLADIGEPLVDPTFGDVNVILPHTPTVAQLWDDLPEASGLAIDQMRQAAKPQGTQGVPAVDKDGNPVPPGHSTQVPPGHPAAVRAVADQKAEQEAQRDKQLQVANAAARGLAAAEKPPQEAQETALAAVRAHAALVLDRARREAP